MKLKDIRKNLEESLDISDLHVPQEYELIWEASESFKDIETGKGNIDVRWDKKIVLEIHEWKSIDAVGKKSYFSKDISLQKQKSFQDSAAQITAELQKIRITPPKTHFFNEKRIGNIYFLFFLCFSFFLWIFLYKDVLEKYLTYSYETLSQVKTDFPDYKKVNEHISESRSSFLVTYYLFKPISFLHTSSINDAYRLIQWGRYLTESFEKFSRIGFDLILLTETKEIWDILFSHFFDNSQWNFLEALKDLREANSYYSQIVDLWENDLNEKLVFLKDTISELVEKWDFLEKNYDTVLSMFGHKERKKYMIVFQNSDEIRPQGWFMGSVWFIEVFWWKVESFEKKDIYALEWEINKDPFREPAPEWIDRLTQTFWLRDANYYIWVGKSSEKIKEILARWNISIDGIIYTNINLAKDLLSKSWDFDSKTLWMTITDKNFSLVMSSLVESKKSREATLDSPKNILFDFIDEYMDYLKQEEDIKKYMSVFVDAMRSRDIFFYSFDTQAQTVLNTFELDGAIDFSTWFDFNYPVFTSLSWNKSDRYLQRSFSKYVTIKDNCDIQTRLNMKLRHNFSLANERDAISIFEKYDIDVEGNLFIQWLGPNKQFIRVVVPKEAQITNKNLTIREYPTTKVVELYIDTPRFESNYHVLSYILKNPECRNYEYKFYKQPGIHDYNFDFHLWTESFKFTWIRQDFEYTLAENSK